MGYIISVITALLRRLLGRRSKQIQAPGPERVQQFGKLLVQFLFAAPLIRADRTQRRQLTRWLADCQREFQLLEEELGVPIAEIAETKAELLLSALPARIDEWLEMIRAHLRDRFEESIRETLGDGEAQSFMDACDQAFAGLLSEVRQHFNSWLGTFAITPLGHRSAPPGKTERLPDEIESLRPETELPITNEPKADALIEEWRDLRHFLIKRETWAQIGMQGRIDKQTTMLRNEWKKWVTVSTVCSIGGYLLHKYGDRILQVVGATIFGG